MKLKPGAYFLIVILLFSLALVLRALTFPSTEAKFLPILIGGIVFVLTVVALIRELRMKKEPKKERESWEGEELELRQYKTIGAWVGVFALGIWVLGFLIAIPAFIISYLKIHGTGWVKSFILAAVMLGFLYGIFELILRVELYRGLVFHWLGLST